MKELLIFLIQNITGSEDFKVREAGEDSSITFEVKAKPEIIGLIIGKEGRTIKNIRRIMSIRATLEKVAVNIAVNEA